jgi:hypothetical protein
VFARDEIRVECLDRSADERHRCDRDNFADTPHGVVGEDLNLAEPAGA